MRRTTTQRGYGAQWQQVARHEVDVHVARYGWLCPGDPAYDHDMHPSHDLTVDHVDPTDPNTRLEVVCRALNTRRMNAA